MNESDIFANQIANVYKRFLANLSFSNKRLYSFITIYKRYYTPIESNN